MVLSGWKDPQAKNLVDGQGRSCPMAGSLSQTSVAPMTSAQEVPP